MLFFKFKEFLLYKRLVHSGNINSTSNYMISSKIKKSLSVKQKVSIILSIGVGISVINVIRKSYKKNLPNVVDDSMMTESPNNLMMQCYYYLPWRITSRMIGWLASIEVPLKFRPFLYNKYAKFFGVNLDEIDCDLQLFPSLVDFFVRPLKPEARPIAINTNIVSPADGTILYLGPVLSSKVHQVKGITYNLRHFLGDKKSQSYDEDEKSTTTTTTTTTTNQDNDDYVKSLLKNPNNSLYQLTVYLAPGDYHRFHSATEWKIKLRRHFQGKLLSVNPKIATWFPDLFEINERVVYIGNWAEGFMAYAAIGATNVGSIKVYCDNTLQTNTKWKKKDNEQELDFISTQIDKGQLFGEFRLGSTIVLLFEAPKEINFSVKLYQKIKMGEALTKLPIKFHRNKFFINLNQFITDALNIIGFC